MALTQRVELAAGWQAKLNAPVDELLTRLGDGISEDAKRLVPVRTGELRDSIEASVDNHELIVSADKPYAATVEFGDDSRNQPSQPYLRPAIYRRRAVA